MQGRAHKPGGWHCPQGAASSSRKAHLEHHAALVLHAVDLLRLGDGPRGDPQHAQTLRNEPRHNGHHQSPQPHRPSGHCCWTSGGSRVVSLPPCPSNRSSSQRVTELWGRSACERPPETGAGERASSFMAVPAARMRLRLASSSATIEPSASSCSQCASSSSNAPYRRNLYSN